MLVFGLASSPYLFSKCLRAIVKFWRQNSINIVLYLDDGFEIAQTYDDCDKVSTVVRTYWLGAGVLINEEKYIFKTIQSLEWLGIIWDTYMLLCVSKQEE